MPAADSNHDDEAPNNGAVAEQLTVLARLGLAPRPDVDTHAILSASNDRWTWLNEYVDRSDQAPLKPESVEFLRWYFLINSLGSSLPDPVSDSVLLFDLENDANYAEFLDHLDRISGRVVRPTGVTVEGLDAFEDDASETVTISFTSTAGDVDWTLRAFGDFLDPAVVAHFDALLGTAAGGLQLWAIAAPDPGDDLTLFNVVLNAEAQSVLALALTSQQRRDLEQTTPLRFRSVSE